MKALIAFLLGVLLLLLHFPGLERDITIPENVVTVEKGYINGEFVSPQLTLEYQINPTIVGTTWTLYYSPIGYFVDHVYLVKRHK